MSDKYIGISGGLELIAKAIDKLSDTILKFMAWKEAVDPDLEYDKPQIIVKEEIIKKGKYTWIICVDGAKIRKCNNDPCPYYLKYNEDMKKYQHGKYDVNTNMWVYVQEGCDYYQGGSK